jgi:hypothetical protein
MNTFYFNTGVQTLNINNFPYEYHRKVGNVISSNGVLQCPFDCDAPKDAELMFLYDKPDLPESKVENVIVRKVFNTSMASKYVYLRINKTN